MWDKLKGLWTRLAGKVKEIVQPVVKPFQWLNRQAKRVLVGSLFVVAISSGPILVALSILYGFLGFGYGAVIMIWSLILLALVLGYTKGMNLFGSGWFGRMVEKVCLILNRITQIMMTTISSPLALLALIVWGYLTVGAGLGFALVTIVALIWWLDVVISQRFYKLVMHSFIHWVNQENGQKAEEKERN